MTDDLPTGLPDGFRLHAADHGERVETDDGRRFVVLESARTSDKQLVYEDVVEYDTIDHPAITGLLGMWLIAAGLIAPIGIGADIAVSSADLTVALAASLGGVVGGFGVANLMLNRTIAGDWCFRFLEWNDHKHLIMGREGSL